MEKKDVVIEQPNLVMRYLESCNFINDISGRKCTQSTQLNGDSAEDIVVLWYEHLRKLLGNSPEVIDKNEEIPPVFENLHIFTFGEYKKANRSVKRGKSAGEDCIISKVVKYVPIDDIFIAIINK